MRIIYNNLIREYSLLLDCSHETDLTLQKFIYKECHFRVRLEEDLEGIRQVRKLMIVSQVLTGALNRGKIVLSQSERDG